MLARLTCRYPGTSGTIKRVRVVHQPKGSICMITRIRTYIVDSYNGLYKIVIEPSMPTKQTVLLLILGLLLGMFFAYTIFAVQFYDGAPHQLSQQHRDNWVRFLAGSYQAGIYDAETVQGYLASIENPGGVVQRLLGTSQAGSAEQAALQNIQGLADAANPGKAAPSDGGLFNSLLSFIVPIILVVVITPIVVVVWRLLLYPNIFAPLWDKIRPKSEEELERRRKAEIDKQARLQAIEAQKSMEVAVDAELGEPLMQRLSVYAKGRQYDDSFAIETEADEFLGECGAAISKTIGDSNELTAVEIWLFDKDDFVRTLTKIFASEHALNDPAIRADLESKVEDPANDLILVREGANLFLDTNAIRVHATVKSVTFGSEPGLPPNSHFEAMNIEIAAWHKQGNGASAPAAPPMPAMPTTQAAPMAAPPPSAPPPPMTAPPTSPAAMPPAAPSPSQPTEPITPAGSTPQPLRPLSPPPLQPTSPVTPPPPPATMPPPEDDPFGGTGDFTPLNDG